MDIENLHKFIHDPYHIRNRPSFFQYKEKYPNLDDFLTDFLELPLQASKQEFQKKKLELEKKYKYDRIKNVILLYLLKVFYSNDRVNVEQYNQFLSFLQSKSCRSNSGILEVAIMTAPDNMAGSNDGCDYNCYFCPKQKGFPRSYIKEEPAVRRANQFGFDPVKQFHDRVSSYVSNGHDGDKLEVIVLGGTWSSYEYEYQKKFITQLYYSANTFYHNHQRTMKTLEEEIQENETSLCKIIGLTIETRPDQINITEIQRYLDFGVTRVQLGIQTTNDKILKKINRGCYNIDTIKALRLLKIYGFKVLIHIMPNLPGSNPEIDKQTIDDVLFNEDFQADEFKIYPTSVTMTSEIDDQEVYTVIEKWFREGKYVPYSNEELFEVLYYLKENIPEYIRISRIFRDIPISNITGGANIPHMRQVVQSNMAEQGKYCKCIRCREIKNRKIKLEDIYYKTISYMSNRGTEYYISANVPALEGNPYQSTLLGFLRLRINPQGKLRIPTLQNSSIVRELHVYGRMKPTYDKNSDTNHTQHRGIGKELLKKAEDITRDNALNKISVISGVGVRKYYEKRGYRLENSYMTKNLEWDTSWIMIILFPMILIVIWLLFVN